MLEKSDLHQIKEIVEEVVERKLEEKLGQRFAEQENRLDQKLKPIHKKLNKLQKDLDITIRSLDNDHLKNRQRIERIENHLQLPHFAP